MYISLNLISINSARFIQQRFIQSISERQKIILVIVVAAFALLAACFAMTRYCFRKADVINDKPKTDGDQSPEKIAKDKESPVKPVEDAVARKATVREAPKKSEPTDSEPSPAKSPDQLPLKEIEEPIADENIEENELKEDATQEKKDEPKKTLAQMAAGVDFHAGFMVQAIDDTLAEKKDLSQGDKDQLAALKDQELEKKGLMQQLIDMEKQEISRLKSEEVAINANLSAKQGQLGDLQKEIADIHGEIEQQKKYIEKQLAKIDRYSQGNHEQVLNKVSFAVDDVIEKIKGVKYRASEFKGILTYQFDIDKIFADDNRR